MFGKYVYSFKTTDYQDVCTMFFNFVQIIYLWKLTCLLSDRMKI